MKQTAVEWLEEKLLELFEDHLPFELLDQSKEMEKQQIVEAHGNQTKKSGGITNYTYILTGEQYYNETFKK